MITMTYSAKEKRNTRFKLSNCRVLFILKVSLLWTMSAAMVATMGYVVWCKSFKVNSCAFNIYMDWFAFTPKHSDCFHARYYQLQIIAVLWGSFLWQSYDYYKSMK
ncbi:uncharacterized protein LOC110231285 isoform X2 [Exaiptasia diaphana]|uniref:Uncharacterized protein n=1 Tax=Exaiptasia diaphana TaxID=2652724 RepID=A0A913WP37_EXADI|nr:uncharacterized protein LOC110231285 isoform X2 [Exaiptasia diaphana]